MFLIHNPARHDTTQARGVSAVLQQLVDQPLRVTPISDARERERRDLHDHDMIAACQCSSHRRHQVSSETVLHPVEIEPECQALSGHLADLLENLRRRLYPKDLFHFPHKALDIG